MVGPKFYIILVLKENTVALILTNYHTFGERALS